MIEINQNIPKEVVENILNQVRELHTEVGYAVNIYPFKIVSGLTRFTETGEKQIAINSADFRNCIDIINSSEPIVCYWEGAFQTVTTVQERDYQTKIFSENNAKKIKCYITDYNKNIDTNQVSLGAPGKEKAYTYITLTRNISLFTIEWKPTDDDLRNYFFIVVDKKANSPQLLRAVSSSPIHKPNGEYLGSNVTFTNINLAYAQSGKDILSFPKLCNPGGNYAFPKEVETKNGIQTVLDSDILNSTGINDIQLFFEGAYALNSILVVGRPAHPMRVYAPRRLLLINPHPPIISSLDVTASLVNEYYACFSTRPVFDSFWENWKDKVVVNYNNTTKKTYMGGITLNYADTEQTNPLDSSFRKFNLWNGWNFKPTDTKTYDTSDVWACDTSITIANDANISVSDFLNHNSFIYSCYEQLPLEYNEFTKYTLGDYGLIGKISQGFANILTLNLIPPIGWLTSSNPLPRKEINLLMPVCVYNIGKTICANSELQPIPYDVFTNSEDFTGGGNQNINCGFRFELTDLFLSPSQVNHQENATIGTGKNGYWNTMYLGQTAFKDGTTFYQASNGEFETLIWKSDCRAFKNNNQFFDGYEVDFIQYQGVGKANCRLSFNKYVNGDFTKPLSTWEARQQTNALFKDDIKLWRNQQKLNFSEEANNSGTMNYPQVLVPNDNNYGTSYYLFDTDLVWDINTSFSPNASGDISAINIAIADDTEIEDFVCDIFERTGLTMEDINNHYSNSSISFDVEILPNNRGEPLSAGSVTKHFDIRLTDFINNKATEIIPTEFFCSTSNDNIGSSPNILMVSKSEDPSIDSSIDLKSAFVLYRSTDSFVFAYYLMNSTTPIVVNTKINGNQIAFNFDKFNDTNLTPTFNEIFTERTIPAQWSNPLDSGAEYIGEWVNIPQTDNGIFYLILDKTADVGIYKSYDPNIYTKLVLGGAFSHIMSFRDTVGTYEISKRTKRTGALTDWNAEISLEINDQHQARIKVKWTFNTPNILEPKPDNGTFDFNLWISNLPFTDTIFAKTCRVYGQTIAFWDVDKYEITQKVNIRYKLKNAIINLVKNEVSNGRQK